MIGWPPVPHRALIVSESMLTTFFVFEPGAAMYENVLVTGPAAAARDLGARDAPNDVPAATTTSAMVDTISAAVPRVPRIRFILSSSLSQLVQPRLV